MTCFYSGFVLTDGQKQGEKGGLKVNSQTQLPQERESCFQLSAPGSPPPPGACVWRWDN